MIDIDGIEVEFSITYVYDGGDYFNFNEYKLFLINLLNTNTDRC